MNSKEVKEEIQHSLREWGVRERCNEHHIEFRQKVLQAGLEMTSVVRSEVNYQDAKKDTSFPLNISHAYEKVLKSDVDCSRQKVVYLSGQLKCWWLW